MEMLHSTFKKSNPDQETIMQMLKEHCKPVIMSTLFTLSGNELSLSDLSCDTAEFDIGGFQEL